MAIVTKYYCDKCGAECPSGYKNAIRIDYEGYDKYNFYWLCDEHLKQIMEFIPKPRKRLW